MNNFLGAIAIVVSVAALSASWRTSRRQHQLDRHANSLPVLVEMLALHRGPRLAKARRLAHERLHLMPPDTGLEDMPGEEGELVLELSWFYDNLGALVAHDVVDLAPVSGYLGTSVIGTWKAVEPFVRYDRMKRAGSADPERYQIYFENLAKLVHELPPAEARRTAKHWRLP